MTQHPLTVENRTVPDRLRLAANGIVHAVKRRETRYGYLFMLPSMITLSVFVFWPIVQSFILSLQKWQLNGKETVWVGFDNYRRLFEDVRVQGAFTNTLQYTAVVVPASLIIALLLALALNERVPGRTIFRAAFFLPVIASFAIIAIVWRFLLNPDIGLLAYWSSQAGIPTRAWLRDVRYAMPAVMIISIWKNLGFNMVILLAGLQGIPDVYYEAAKVDGASRWARFRHVTMPMLRPTWTFVLIISIISSFQVFDQVWVLTPRGGPLHSTETIVTYIYYQGIELLDISYAASIGVILFAIVLVLTLVQLRLFRFREVDL
ncbi:MAG TPA: sugar ABC transporter permease [Aggregatilinea sp.]|uniref:carbohydrate ABC transporter permease n=1 Tax=Aggregatilinea sp. TaxID=2806333 RepID=UPI002BFBA599|nr:sugar ABC transporter permease [Aggregatilinea sp.]HML20225.1 sugar ABC transporter permease [Aggregatilinea sp.]